MNLLRSMMLIALVLCVTGCVMTPPPRPDRGAEERIDAATAMLQRGDLSRARAMYEIVLEEAPYAAAIDGLGCVSFLEGDYAAAERLFRRALDEDDSYTNALSNLALLYEVEGREAEAREMYEQAMAANLRDGRVRHNYAAFHYDEGMRTDEVRELLLQAEALLPGSPLIRESLANIK